MAYLGLAMAVLGVVLILLGVIGAAKDVFMKQGKGFAGVEPKLPELLLKVILQILKGPAWLIMLVMGAGLVYFGHQLNVGGWPFA
jgi:hypothetical protein